ncbi:3377_t:CDS:2 [Entrophospora sp. SA101]|nr:3377_t:CDS:2 [Entrophospora sp. SA101]
MTTVDREYGYIFYFKEGEPKMLGKEPHIHIWGHGKEIQYYLSPLRLKSKKPKNFPQGEKSRLYQIVKERKAKYLDKLREIEREIRKPAKLKAVRKETCQHPRILKLEISKSEITAFLDDGRKTSIPTDWFCPNQGNRDRKDEVRHPETGGHNYNFEKCPSCQAVIKIIKSNGHGDQTEEIKEHAANCQQSHSSSTSQNKNLQFFNEGEDKDLGVQQAESFEGLTDKEKIITLIQNGNVELTRENQTLKEEINALKERIASNEEELKQEREVVKKMPERQINADKREISRLIADIEELNRVVEEKDREASQLRRETNEAKNALETINKLLTQKENETIQLINESTLQNANEVENLRRQSEGYEQEIARLTNYTRELEQNFANKSKELEIRKQEEQVIISDTETDNERGGTPKVYNKDQVKELVKSLKSYQRINRELEEQLANQSRRNSLISNTSFRLHRVSTSSSENIRGNLFTEAKRFLDSPVENKSFFPSSPQISDESKKSNERPTHQRQDTSDSVYTGLNTDSEEEKLDYFPLIDDLRSQLAAKENEIRNLESEQLRKIKENEALTNENIQKQNRIDALRDELSYKQKQIDEANKLIAPQISLDTVEEEQPTSKFNDNLSASTRKRTNSNSSSLLNSNWISQEYKKIKATVKPAARDQKPTDFNVDEHEINERKELIKELEERVSRLGAENKNISEELARKEAEIYREAEAANLVRIELQETQESLELKTAELEKEKKDYEANANDLNTAKEEIKRMEAAVKEAEQALKAQEQAETDKRTAEDKAKEQEAKVQEKELNLATVKSELNTTQSKLTNYENYLQTILGINNFNNFPSNNTGKSLVDLVNFYNNSCQNHIDRINTLLTANSINHSQLKKQLQDNGHIVNTIQLANKEQKIIDELNRDLNLNLPEPNLKKVINRIQQLIKQDPITITDNSTIESLEQELNQANQTITKLEKELTPFGEDLAVIKQLELESLEQLFNQTVDSAIKQQITQATSYQQVVSARQAFIQKHLEQKQNVQSLPVISQTQKELIPQPNQERIILISCLVASLLTVGGLLMKSKIIGGSKSKQ